ncbi:thymocyte nuclear protein 1 isoform X1 [Peromyscus eremicus]|uniref:thymocyte nuclear protein 1 isoform X1 n=1 Tax=Peromyscus eremicus TaxID=42410 RepID=UPI0027DD4AB3|nr:thymocyte nuclear protein 1 isoform X1 [Peromyscus eremicus]
MCGYFQPPAERTCRDPGRGRLGQLAQPGRIRMGRKAIQRYREKKGGVGRDEIQRPQGTRCQGTDKKGLSEKRPKTENSENTSAKLENASPQKTSTSKNCGKNLSNYWLMKSEPESRLEKGVDVKFSIEDLKAQPKQIACWDGVRNYQARNFLRAMKLEEEAFFYHSNCKQPGIVGLMKIVKEAYPDHTQFEKNNPHYDPSSKEDNPKWSMVDVQFVRMMKRFISLDELKTYHQAHKATGGPLKNMTLFTRQRLSVQPLTREEFDFVLSLEETEPS